MSSHLVVAALVLCSVAAAAQPAKPLRELSTDRPDRTESPITVDKGHFQIELDLFSFARRSSVNIFDVAGINAKLGLSDNVDVQVVSQAHERLRFGSTTVSSSFPDLTVRLKINRWGNDGGRTALALMPFLTLPRHGGGRGFGLIVPWSTELGGPWSLGLMSEIDLAQGNDPTLVNTATFGRSLTDAVGAYFELASEMPDLAARAMAWTFDTGLTRGVGANIQFDGGVNVGLNDNAEKVRVFVGVSRRY